MLIKTTRWFCWSKTRELPTIKSSIRVHKHYQRIINAMREIEGLYIKTVNSPRKTTHLRLYTDTKEIIMERARREEMTVPKYMRRMVKDYLERSIRGEYL